MAADMAELQKLFTRVDGLRVGILGDFCLDVYWHADMRLSELSRETPHYPLPIVGERMQPGAAGNVACNLAALKPAEVLAFTVIGKDWRGAVLKSLLLQNEINTSGMLEADDCVTNAYIKPMRQGMTDVVYEDPRLDFENHEALSPEWEDALLEQLKKAAPALDMLYVCDQLRFGCVTERVRQYVITLGGRGLPILVDSRDRIGMYRHVIAKPNEVELCRAVERPVTEAVQVLAQYARALQAKTERPLLVTLGEKGSMILEDGQITRVAAFPVEPPVDICGAGDSFGATAALLHAAGAPLSQAAAYASCSASLTVQKLAMTGVTTRAELLARVGDAPDLMLGAE